MGQKLVDAIVAPGVTAWCKYRIAGRVYGPTPCMVTRRTLVGAEGNAWNIHVHDDPSDPVVPRHLCRDVEVWSGEPDGIDDICWLYPCDTQGKEMRVD